MESDCDTCGGWAVADFTFSELCAKWHELIGGKITEGYERRYQREGERLGVPWEELRLPFKYCTRGRLTRFYIVKGPADTRSKKSIRGCPHYFLRGVDTSEFPVPSPLWTVCHTESHGPTTLKGQQFVPGLCENRVYFRLPTHGKVEPERVEAGNCDVCGKDF